jgi:hypothetical protein
VRILFRVPGLCCHLPLVLLPDFSSCIRGGQQERALEGGADAARQGCRIRGLEAALLLPAQWHAPSTRHPFPATRKDGRGSLPASHSLPPASPPCQVPVFGRGRDRESRSRCLAAGATTETKIWMPRGRESKAEGATCRGGGV